mmetsp:Transcript_18606/g.40744  ORF Transcript_18606/g.40744 Transcript_18606/m.40744 type:complete len:205 (-) Transcript_18606:833-1447(-)
MRARDTRTFWRCSRPTRSSRVSRSLRASPLELACCCCCSRCSARDSPKAVQKKYCRRQSNGNRNGQVTVSSRHQRGSPPLHSVSTSCSWRLSLEASLLLTNSSVATPLPARGTASLVASAAAPPAESSPSRGPSRLRVSRSRSSISTSCRRSTGLTLQVAALALSSGDTGAAHLGTARGTSISTPSAEGSGASESPAPAASPSS